VRDGLTDQKERESLRNSMLGMLMDASQESRTVSFDGAITGCGQFREPRFCLQGMVNCPPFSESVMNIIRLGTDFLHLQLRSLSDEDMWWLFLNHREACSREFWEELESRKAAGILSGGSPFWSISNMARYPRSRGPAYNSNLIEPTREEWEARKRRKMFRVMSA
jgi:hypothetical protein